MKLHPNQLKMLKRRGFRLFDTFAGTVAVGKGLALPLNKAVLHCRRLNRREAQARYRLAHKREAAAYMRAYKARAREGR